MALARKSLRQSYSPPSRLPIMMEEFKQMTNDCIRIGLAYDAASLKRLSSLSYNKLKRYDMS